MLFWDQRGRGMILVAAVAGAVVLLISQFGNTQIFDERMRQTVEGNKSDDLRVRLFQASLEIALENPIIGVSPQAFPAHVATKLGFHGAQLESHNTLGHLMGGSGFFCLLAYGAFCWSMLSPFPASEWPRLGRPDPLYEARSLCRMMIMLWVIRGMFTREILYNPAFNVGVGLCIGLLVLALSSRRESLTPASATVS
jgi:O-antigen ligase